MRIFIAIIFSLVISIAMFVLMQKMTSADSEAVKEKTNPIQLTYLRDKKDTDIERKKRIKPKEPIKKVEPKNLKFKAELNQKLNKNVKVKPLAVNTNI